MGAFEKKKSVFKNPPSNRENQTNNIIDKKLEILRTTRQRPVDTEGGGVDKQPSALRSLFTLHGRLNTFSRKPYSLFFHKGL